MTLPRSQVRVFLSHSHANREFVDRLAADLEERDLPVWIDRRALGVGDSIVAGISGGLTESDYLIVVLSRASVESPWVQAELNAALYRQIDSTGTGVLPVLLEPCDVPVLLQDRVYADFSSDYDVGLRALLDVLDSEAEPCHPCAASSRSSVDVPVSGQGGVGDPGEEGHGGARLGGRCHIQART